MISCTGCSSLLDEDKAHAMGVRAFLLMLVDRTSLAGTVRRVLDASL